MGSRAELITDAAIFVPDGTACLAERRTRSSLNLRTFAQNDRRLHVTVTLPAAGDTAEVKDAAAALYWAAGIPARVLACDRLSQLAASSGE
jgi:hypothetical protein